MPACCDICGKPYVKGDMVYTIASKYDGNDNLISFRHGKCQPSQEQLRRNFDEAMRKAQGAVSKLRGLFDE